MTRRNEVSEQPCLPARHAGAIAIVSLVRFYRGRCLSRMTLIYFLNMKNKQPLVSIIMPVYNAGDFLVEAIESIVKQSYKNLELIIVDDRSTDNSWEIITIFARRYPRKIKAVKTKYQTNAAGNGAMNYGLKYAKGEFICRMDADDIALPTRIVKQVSYMTTHPETILLGTQAYVINKDGKNTGKKNMPLTHQTIYEQYGVFHPIIHPSLMIRRSLLPNPNRIYDMKWDVNDDYFTFFKLLNRGQFANLPEFLLKYRVHGKNASLVKPKQKFINSVKIRLAAIKETQYKFSIKSALLFLLQIAVVLPIPERFIVPVYLYAKGISKPFSTLVISSAARNLAKRFFERPFGLDSSIRLRRTRNDKISFQRTSFARRIQKSFRAALAFAQL